MIPLSGSKPAEGDGTDARFWTRERCIELSYELTQLVVKILQAIADGGGGG
ncbi:hypothetical protein ACGFYE_33370 [Streptomyces zaomyceticus]|uniref:hypothetical protein n=1 Tax=Streptomyces zaomyceticus TaxID=68286 RepID=UPI0037230B5A